jgi:hypothetical protein
MSVVIAYGAEVSPAKAAEQSASVIAIAIATFISVPFLL